MGPAQAGPGRVPPHPARVDQPGLAVGTRRRQCVGMGAGTLMQLPETIIGTVPGLVAFPRWQTCRARRPGGTPPHVGRVAAHGAGPRRARGRGLILLGRIPSSRSCTRGVRSMRAPRRPCSPPCASMRWASPLTAASSLLRAFFEQKDMVTPLLLAVASAVANIALRAPAPAPLGAGGLALANSIAITAEVPALLAHPQAALAAASRGGRRAANCSRSSRPPGSCPLLWGALDRGTASRPRQPADPLGGRRRAQESRPAPSPRRYIRELGRFVQVVAGQSDAARCPVTRAEPPSPQLPDRSPGYNPPDAEGSRPCLRMPAVTRPDGGDRTWMDCFLGRTMLLVACAAALALLAGCVLPAVSRSCPPIAGSAFRRATTSPSKPRRTARPSPSAARVASGTQLSSASAACRPG